jgi:thiol-disulfide isomerase/thioredoxin
MCLMLVSFFNMGVAQDLSGQPAPGFSLQDINGKTVSLNDFKGKVVYIDVWATWCGPCVAEIPHSKKLKEKYKDKTDIVFLYISFDSEEKKWKSFVEKKELSGVQLISRQGKEADVLKNYNVLTIPRFILINKKGNIASYDAKRPSDPELENEINQLLSVE